MKYYFLLLFMCFGIIRKIRSFTPSPKHSIGETNRDDCLIRNGSVFVFQRTQNKFYMGLKKFAPIFFID